MSPGPRLHLCRPGPVGVVSGAPHPQAGFLPLFEMWSRGEAVALEVPGLGSGGTGDLGFTSEESSPGAELGRTPKNQGHHPHSRGQATGKTGGRPPKAPTPPGLQQGTSPSIYSDDVGGKPAAF